MHDPLKDSVDNSSRFPHCSVVQLIDKLENNLSDRSCVQHSCQIKSDLQSLLDPVLQLRCDQRVDPEIMDGFLVSNPIDADAKQLSNMLFKERSDITFDVS